MIMLIDGADSLINAANILKYNCVSTIKDGHEEGMNFFLCSVAQNFDSELCSR